MTLVTRYLPHPRPADGFHTDVPKGIGPRWCTIIRLWNRGDAQSSITKDLLILDHFNVMFRIESQFWSSLQPPTSDYNTQDGDEFAKEESNEHLETLKFAFPKKVKARGQRKANVNKRRVTFAD
ncbi:hypothetical protein ALC53_04668 [Atta colombica]|uniref:Uncharacterized protein n=1 Tax=Atta colombica TaxID=520822 RepID=A0A195BL36_9HYME|nr:hypothetical protein ALC53_04668 [Atta colombica]